ncbi:MAG: hypothetical protein AAGG44_12640, partial [Planctomycetota bacterium]
DVLETIAVQEGNTFHENAALFAQASVAMADAGVAAWHTKFSEQFWRPVTAIHDGDTDGNDLTAGDPEWTAIGAPDGGDDIIGFTPQFPTYVSGHATFGGALFGAIREFYGTDDIAFDLTSRELEIIMENPELEEAYGLDLNDASRSFDNLTEAMAENGRSRVYLGIHFDFDDTVGQEVGQAVAATVAAQFPSNGDRGRPSDDRPRDERRENDRPRNDRPDDDRPVSGMLAGGNASQDLAGLPLIGSDSQESSDAADLSAADLALQALFPETIDNANLEMLAEDQARRHRGEGLRRGENSRNELDLSMPTGSALEEELL